MSRFLCKSILSTNIYALRNVVQSQTTNTNANYTLRLFSISQNQDSFTVSYLMNTFGFSHTDALSASKLVNLKTPQKADQAIEFLKKFGFTQTQISNLVILLPQVLLMKTEKTVLPKLEFLESKGISRPELAKAISTFPEVIFSSLDKQIMPGYKLILCFFKSNEKVNAVFRRHPYILIKKVVKQNIDVLKKHGVPKSNIAALILRQPSCFLQDSGRFREIVEQVVAMGFDSSKGSFVAAVLALGLNSKSRWDSKVDMYKKCGFSDEEFVEAFKREPKFMLVSEEKISACMEYFTKRMGFKPCDVVKAPLTVKLSLDQRVIPRCSVYRILISKRLVKEPLSLRALLLSTEKDFIKSFVVPNMDHAPEILKLLCSKKKKISAGKV